MVRAPGLSGNRVGELSWVGEEGREIRRLRVITRSIKPGLAGCSSVATGGAAVGGMGGAGGGAGGAAGGGTGGAAGGGMGGAAGGGMGGAAVGGMGGAAGGGMGGAAAGCGSVWTMRIRRVWRW